MEISWKYHGNIMKISWKDNTQPEVVVGGKCSQIDGVDTHKDRSQHLIIWNPVYNVRQR